MTRTRLYEELRRDLLKGRFTSEELLTERALTEAYGVSRTPVREALNRLEQDGLIVRSLRGYRVQSGTPEDVIEIYDVRAALERAAAEAAAVRRTELQLAGLVQVQRDAEASTDPLEARRMHSRWHELLWAASHNATLETMLGSLVTRLRIFDTESSHRNDIRETFAEHERVLSALRSRDAAAAGAAIAEHLHRTKQERLAAYARRAVSDSPSH